MATVVRVKCQGTRPIMFGRMSEEILEHLRKGTRPQSNKDADPMRIAEDKMYKGPNGELCIPADNFWAALVEAGAFVGFKGKRNLSNSEESVLPGVLNIREDYLTFTDGQGWRVDQRRGRLDNGTAVCIVRPLFPEWGFTATLEIDDSQVSVEKIKEVVETAGRFKGLGEHRKKGRYGRFAVVGWEILEGPKSSGNGSEKTSTRGRRRQPAESESAESSTSDK